VTRALAAAFGVALLLAAGCASTPHATAARDAEAKAFRPQADASTVYVFRTDRPTADGFDSMLILDDHLVGSTLPGSFYRVIVPPGRHVLQGFGPDAGSMAFDAPGKDMVFVELVVVAGHSHFTVVPPAYGQASIRACCHLLENWAPGQRPLLR